MAATCLARLAWAGPRRGGEEFSALHLSSSEGDKSSGNKNFAGAKLVDPVTQVNVGLISGLVLGAQEFQMR